LAHDFGEPCAVCAPKAHVLAAFKAECADIGAVGNEVENSDDDY
jgi:hypothetical protein